MVAAPLLIFDKILTDTRHQLVREGQGLPEVMPRIDMYSGKGNFPGRNAFKARCTSVMASGVRF